MTTERPLPTNHHHAFNFHTGRPRFHFEEPPPTPPPAPPVPPPAPWHTGVDAEFIGHAQNKGWKLDDPKEAFVAATKQARELERHFGVPPEQLVKIPKADASPTDIRAYYEKIGTPKEAKDYDLSAMKDQSLADTFRTAAHTAGVPKDAATAISKALQTALDSRATEQNTLDTAKLADQKANLQKNWGDKFAYNHLQAIEGARRLGISPEGVKALEGVIGYDSVMEAMRKIGANTREDTFVVPPGGQPGEVTTVEGAKARKLELEGDKAWVDRYLKGGQAEKREMDRLIHMIVGAAA